MKDLDILEGEKTRCLLIPLLQPTPTSGASSSSSSFPCQRGATLRMQVRTKQGRDAEPSAAIIDSQSIKTSSVRGSEKGYDMGKKTRGRKRHLLVDTQGHLLAVKVTGAEVSDQEGGKALLAPLKALLPTMRVIWGDSHYGGAFLM